MTVAEELSAAFTNEYVFYLWNPTGSRSFVIGRKENSHVYKAQQVKMSVIERFLFPTTWRGSGVD